MTAPIYGWEAENADAALSEFCAGAFASLSRADQRHAAETYVRGLLSCSGRKTIPRLATAVAGRSEQSLQQFINQSPWDPQPVRKWLWSLLVERFRPAAWFAGEVVFPKHGRFSAAVERQYVHSHQRVRNCQLAVMVALEAEGEIIPVNWQLSIPDSWGRDCDRRTRARIPEHERPRPYWQYHLELLDDMALDWGLVGAPVAFDARNRPVGSFLQALELRGQAYVAEVSANDPVSGAAHGRATSTVAELVERAGQVRPETVHWRGERGYPFRSQFLDIPVAQPAAAAGRSLLVEWPYGKDRPRAFWLTNMRGRELPELVALAKRVGSTGSSVEQAMERFGLFDYEGRTFVGWHHHVTLVGVAQAFDLIQRGRRSLVPAEAVAE